VWRLETLALIIFYICSWRNIYRALLLCCFLICLWEQQILFYLYSLVLYTSPKNFMYAVVCSQAFMLSVFSMLVELKASSLINSGWVRVCHATKSSCVHKHVTLQHWKPSRSTHYSKLIWIIFLFFQYICTVFSIWNWHYIKNCNCWLVIDFRYKYSKTSLWKMLGSHSLWH